MSETVTAPRPEIQVSRAAIGSRVVQEVPAHAGPRVSIRAEVSEEADSRHVRGIFRVDDDAYVVVGHIDADGVLRIAFPNDPSDDGFVRGNRSYQTNEFFAGFNSQYRFRARTMTVWNTVAAQDTYDGGFGYVFIIASWRPMRFDRFSDGYHWDTFDLVSDSYMNDPRPAIQELASRLVGDNGDAYTVQFARYYNTQVISSSYNTIALGYDSAPLCAGYAPVGFTSFGYARFGYPGYSGFNYNAWYRGSRYYYDSFGDCYRQSSPYGFGIGYRIAYTPVLPPPRARPRIFDPTGHRPSPRPQDPPRYALPTTPTTSGDAQIEHRTTPDYRERTTPTDAGNTAGPTRRQPRIEAPTPPEHRDHPIVQMPETPRRAEPREETQPRMAVPQRIDRPERGSPPRMDNPRAEAPRSENPRVDQPRPQPRSEPRSEQPRTAAPRMETPRSEPNRPQPTRAEAPKPERSEAPRSATPRSEPPKSETRKPPG